ncbi:MAG: cobyrinate a,c-diamide synthase [Rhizobiaceae bacterium]|nr:cobyrinate a,c-diamide synthase [Rhizobiaceae bacterium]
MPGGFVIAAPQSGSGKTTITLGLLRALCRAGHVVRSAKAGPDFIDPAFHGAATGEACVNLDPWAMREDLILNLVAENDAFLVVEGMMGLFDGGADGRGSAADLALMLGPPIVLVVDAARQSHSIAALVAGFRDHRETVNMAGVILNKVGSSRHEMMLREALATIDMPVLGCVPRDDRLQQKSRHLGLVQAREHGDLEGFLDGAADVMAQSIDVDALLQLTGSVRGEVSGNAPPMPPPGQRIAIARDDAFAFLYPHLLAGWQSVGAEIQFFSPLNDETPFPDCDAVYLPGGYPELHGGKLAGNHNFKDGLKQAADRGALVYGECGGYMVLGESLIDADGEAHQMANLLPLITSFEKRKLHLGYRRATPIHALPFAPIGKVLTAHEFHYSTVVRQVDQLALFTAKDARGEDLGPCGMVNGNVAGSYLHLIDQT